LRANSALMCRRGPAEKALRGKSVQVRKKSRTHCVVGGHCGGRKAFIRPTRQVLLRAAKKVFCGSRKQTVESAEIGTGDNL
jgi:hypothetical protein